MSTFFSNTAPKMPHIVLLNTPDAVAVQPGFPLWRQAGRSYLAQMAGPILYITFDGVLQPLAFSQVVRLLSKLACSGFSYHLVSVERSQDLADGKRVANLRDDLASAGIEWTAVDVDLAHSARRSAAAISRVTANAIHIARSKRIKLIHARGYQAALVAQTIKRLTGVPYLFDARGYWIDERQDWFSGAATYAIGKFVERGLYRDAAAVVTLTQLHASDVSEALRDEHDHFTVQAIPTCADYDDFILAPCRPGRPASNEVPPWVRARLESKVVLGIVGSLNSSYSVPHTLQLAREVLSQSDRAHLLVLTQQDTAYLHALNAAKISKDAFTIANASHDTMPAWMNWIDWGLLLLPDRLAKRGSMPTKLSEFFASGVRPIAYGCNSEMVAWVRRAGSGVVLDALDTPSVERAAAYVLNAEHEPASLHDARGITAPYFSLNACATRYAALLNSLRC